MKVKDFVVKYRVSKRDARIVEKLFGNKDLTEEQLFNKLDGNIVMQKPSVKKKAKDIKKAVEKKKSTDSKQSKNS